MKRLQIMIEEEMDAALDRMAAAEGVSKAALIRRFVAAHIAPLPRLEQDPLWDMVGLVEGDPGDSSSVDEIVYGT